MKIDIKRKGLQDINQWFTVHLEERLPFYVDKPFDMTFTYRVDVHSEYYTLYVEEKGNVPLVCQRCAEEWIYDYHHYSEIAVCGKEEIAEKYQNSLDVIVCPDLIVDIKDILVDNMHLFLPKKHEKIDQCNQDQLKLIQND
jgi:uncharacterized protein